MERAPLPPHERAWRHPSELAAANRSALSADDPNGTSRSIALIGGAAGVLAVALLVLTLAPHGSDTPVAVSSTSNPGTATSAQLVAPAGLGREISDVSEGSEGTSLVFHPIVTPIGDDGMAVTSSRSILRITQLDVTRVDAREIDVMLVTGHVTRAVVVDPGHDGGIAWVSLDVDAYDHGLDVADEMPRAHDVVTVLADPPMLVEFGHIEQVDAADGTPVVDDDGDVVGMCMQRDGDDDADFTPIGELVGDAPTAEPD